MFVFLTARGKNFYQEIIKSKRVAISAVNEDYVSIRLNGFVERVIDQEYWRDRIFNDNPSMNNVYPGQSQKILEVFVLKKVKLKYLICLKHQFNVINMICKEIRFLEMVI